MPKKVKINPDQKTNSVFSLHKNSANIALQTSLFKSKKYGVNFPGIKNYIIRAVHIDIYNYNCSIFAFYSVVVMSLTKVQALADCSMVPF